MPKESGIFSNAERKTCQPHILYLVQIILQELRGNQDILRWRKMKRMCITDRPARRPKRSSWIFMHALDGFTEGRCNHSYPNYINGKLEAQSNERTYPKLSRESVLWFKKKKKKSVIKENPFNKVFISPFLCPVLHFCGLPIKKSLFSLIF